MHFAHFKVHNTNCQLTPLLVAFLLLNSFFSLFIYRLQITSFFRNNYFQAPFFRISKHCIELSSAKDPYQFTRVWPWTGKSLWSLWTSVFQIFEMSTWMPILASSTQVLGVFFVCVRIDWNSRWSGMKIGTNYWHFNVRAWYL